MCLGKTLDEGEKSRVRRGYTVVCERDKFLFTLSPCVLMPLLNPCNLAAMATVIKSEHQQRLSSRAVHSLPRGRLYT